MSERNYVFGIKSINGRRTRWLIRDGFVWCVLSFVSLELGVCFVFPLLCASLRSCVLSAVEGSKNKIEPQISQITQIVFVLLK